MPIEYARILKEVQDGTLPAETFEHLVKIISGHFSEHFKHLKYRITPDQIYENYVFLQYLYKRLHRYMCTEAGPADTTGREAADGAGGEATDKGGFLSPESGEVYVAETPPTYFIDAINEFLTITEPQFYAAHQAFFDSATTKKINDTCNQYFLEIDMHDRSKHEDTLQQLMTKIGLYLTQPPPDETLTPTAKAKIVELHIWYNGKQYITGLARTLTNLRKNYDDADLDPWGIWIQDLVTYGLALQTLKPFAEDCVREETLRFCTTATEDFISYQFLQLLLQFQSEATFPPASRRTRLVGILYPEHERVRLTAFKEEIIPPEILTQLALKPAIEMALGSPSKYKKKRPLALRTDAPEGAAAARSLFQQIPLHLGGCTSPSARVQTPTRERSLRELAQGGCSPNALKNRSCRGLRIGLSTEERLLAVFSTPTSPSASSPDSPAKRLFKTFSFNAFSSSLGSPKSSQPPPLQRTHSPPEKNAFSQSTLELPGDNSSPTLFARHRSLGSMPALQGAGAGGEGFFAPAVLPEPKKNLAQTDSDSEDEDEECITVDDAFGGFEGPQSGTTP
jgi:hypothetical protein